MQCVWSCLICQVWPARAVCHGSVRLTHSCVSLCHISLVLGAHCPVLPPVLGCQNDLHFTSTPYSSGGDILLAFSTFVSCCIHVSQLPADTLHARCSLVMVLVPHLFKAGP